MVTAGAQMSGDPLAFEKDLKRVGLAARRLRFGQSDNARCKMTLELENGTQRQPTRQSNKAAPATT
jgi:hypothetical protein